MHISPYEHGNIFNKNPIRDRKLLLNRREINKLIGLIKQKGVSIIPTKLYFKNNFVKLEIGIGKGKKLYDKRQDIAKKDAERKIQREKINRNVLKYINLNKLLYYSFKKSEYYTYSDFLINYILFDEPNTSFILCCTVCCIRVLASPKYFLGSKVDGFSAKTFLIAAVIANLKSVSTLIFETPNLLALFNISSGTPFAPGISAP